MSDHLFACATCPREFVLSDTQIAHYRAPGRYIPRHCPRCKADAKAKREADRAIVRQEAEGAQSTATPAVIG